MKNKASQIEHIDETPMPFRSRLVVNCILLVFLVVGNSMAIRGQAGNGRRTLLSSPAQTGRIGFTSRRIQRYRRLADKGVMRRFSLLEKFSTLVADDTSQPKEPRTTFEDPKWRLNWFLFQRTYPSDSIPSQGRFNALVAPTISQPLPAATPTTMTERWQPIGPTPISAKFPSMGVTSGRINAIAISPTDPQTILIGGATGGIWRSTNAGNDFIPVSDDQVDLAVGCITFAPNNGSIVYAGMGDVAGGYMGTGVLKSLDGGQTWRRINMDGPPAPGTIGRIVVDPADPERVYLAQYSYRAATGEGEVYASGLFLSEDGGRKWRKTFTGLPRDLAHHPTRPRILYLSMATTFATSSPSAGVYKSTDGGNSWNPILTPKYLTATDLKIAVTPAEPETIYVYGGLVEAGNAEISLHVSRDGGNTWSDLGHGDLDIGQLGYNTYVTVAPHDARTIYIGTRDLYKSSDRAANWTNLTRNWHRFGSAYSFSPEEATSHSDQHVMAFAPSNPSVIYIGNDGGLSRTMDGGESFESLNRTLSLTQFNSISLHMSDAGRSCGGTQDNGALVRNPQHLQWTEFISGDSGKCFFYPLESGTVFSSYVFGNIFRFKNDGSVFDGTVASDETFSEPSDAPRIGFYPAFAIDTVSGSLYFGSWRLFISIDRGNNWKALAGLKDLTKGVTSFGADVLTSIGIGFAGSNTLYTGSAQGRLMISKNGGADWKDVTDGLPKRFITSIVVSHTSANKSYVTMSGFGSGHIFRTVNGGASWDDISKTLPNIPVNALLVDPVSHDILYAGTDVGVFRSQDDGQNWHRFNNGLPPVIVTGFSGHATGTIQIATYGRGAYELIR